MNVKTLMVAVAVLVIPSMAHAQQASDHPKELDFCWPHCTAEEWNRPESQAIKEWTEEAKSKAPVNVAPPLTEEEKILADRYIKSKGWEPGPNCQVACKRSMAQQQRQLEGPAATPLAAANTAVAQISPKPNFQSQPSYWLSCEDPWRGTHLSLEVDPGKMEVRQTDSKVKNHVYKITNEMTVLSNRRTVYGSVLPQWVTVVIQFSDGNQRRMLNEVDGRLVYRGDGYGGGFMNYCIPAYGSEF
jgi:hypothetical protein